MKGFYVTEHDAVEVVGHIFCSMRNPKNTSSGPTLDFPVTKSQLPLHYRVLLLEPLKMPPLIQCMGD